MEPAPDQSNPTGLIGPFRRPSTGEILVVLRPRVPGYPVEVRVQWAGAGEGREALNELLGGVLVLELDQLADAVVTGASIRLDPLQEFGDRPGWTIAGRAPDDPNRYRLRKDDEPDVAEGPRLDLLLALELALRTALGGVSQAVPRPAWVARAEAAHGRLTAELDGVDLFRPASPPRVA